MFLQKKWLRVLSYIDKPRPGEKILSCLGSWSLLQKIHFLFFSSSCLFISHLAQSSSSWYVSELVSVGVTVLRLRTHHNSRPGGPLELVLGTVSYSHGIKWCRSWDVLLFICLDMPFYTFHTSSNTDCRRSLWTTDVCVNIFVILL